MLSTLATLAFAGAAQATNLFIADYSGVVTSASLTAHGGNYTLNKTSTNTHCAPNPSWLTLDHDRGLMYCLNEGLDTVNGSMSSFTVAHDGELTHVQNTTSDSGPVSGVIYGSNFGKRAIALAHYSGSAISSWILKDNGHFQFNQKLEYTLSKPGFDPDRQEAPHEHEAIIDPTGQYVIVPDLGADLVRVFSYDQATLKLKTLAPLKATPGTGPRHAAFWNPSGVACDGCTTYFYLVGELASTVTGYEVEYLPGNGGLSFKEVYSSSTFGPTLNQPVGNAPAEIQVTPDNRFLVISNRNDSSFTLPISPTKHVPSDSLSTFALHDDGKLTFTQLWPAGGLFPRHFSINSFGSLIAVGLQTSKDVVVLARDIATGLIGEPVARIPLAGEVTCVIFDE